MTPPDFLVVGHLVNDKVPEGYRLGGTAAYASLAAHRLGLRTAILTRAAADLDLSGLPPDIEVHRLPSPLTTVFENIYSGGHRTQYVWAKADAHRRRRRAARAAGSPHRAPGAGGGRGGGRGRALLPAFAGGRRRPGLAAHLRRRRARRPAIAAPVAAARLLRHSRALFVSEEDLPPAETEETLARWTAQVPILFFTLGYRGSRLWSDGRWQDVPAFPAREVDPTGAGDVFAAAFLARYLETDDIAQASLFAAAAAAVSVEAVGTAGIPSRAQVEERLRR